MIGEMECTLAEIVTAGQRYERKLRYKGNWLFFKYILFQYYVLVVALLRVQYKCGHLGRANKGQIT